jgi:uncharacterized protein YhaN
MRETLRELMRSGGADDEEQFRHRADIYERRLALKKDIDGYEDNIKRLSAGLGEINTVKRCLERLDIKSLEEERDKAEANLSDLDSELDELKKDHATLNEQARQLINDERISLLRSEEEALKGELMKASEDWAVLRIAQALLNSARARYESEKQPRVIQEASRFFKTFTSGRYPSLAAPVGEKRIEVVTEDRRRKDISELSRGTAEQLYLSLRFGFIETFATKSETCPVIMDEILVNFDPFRAREAAKAMLELSRRHQILFFTCHPWIVDIFKRVDAGVPVLKIREGRVAV